MKGPTPFQGEIISKLWKYIDKLKKKFFSRTTWPISTKLGTMYPWVMRTLVCWNEGPHLFSRGDNYEIAKIQWKNWKVFFSRTARPISNWYKAPLGKGDSSLFKWRTVKISKIKYWGVFSSFNQRYDIIICVYWF